MRRGCDRVADARFGMIQRGMRPNLARQAEQSDDCE
jgi:hypothetical protein